MPKRRTFTPEFKAQVILEELTGIKDKADICREYRLRPRVFSRWRMDIQAKTKRKKRRTTNSEHDFPRYPNLIQNLEIVRPDQVWVSDVTYIRLCLRLCIPGRDHGRLHPWDSGMASGT